MIHSTSSKNTKIAFLSDIHSNVLALDAVLADIESQDVDIIVNLGDILYGPISPCATYERLMALENEFDKVITIRGNQDRQIVEAHSDSNKIEVSENPTMRFIIDDLSRCKLPTGAITWMQSLPFECQINNDIYVCHGTPTDDMIYLLEDVCSGKPQVREEEQIISLLAGNTSAIIACGHTHIPRTVRLSTGQTIINTGSVGYPAYEDNLPVYHRMQTYSPYASYCLLENVIEGNKSNWTINHKKILYDFKAAADLALQNGRKDWEQALLTGRVV